MADAPERSLEDRVAALEQTVDRLNELLTGLIRALADRERESPPPEPKRSPRPAARPVTVAAAPREPLATPRPKPRVDVAKRWWVGRGMEFWISRVGIGLLLFGLVFLFKYAVDRGWLTPWVQVVLGLALGVGLAAVGLRVGQRRPWFSHIMLGGAAAAFYITGFAGFQLFELVSYPVALGYMVLVTVFTFWVALRANRAALSVLGALGGLGTPFLLYTGSGTLAGLVAYTGVVLVGTSGIYLFKGWRSLLVTTVIGGWSVLMLGREADGALDMLRDRWALQAGVLVAWLAFWAVPVAREVLAARDPVRWPRPRGPILRVFDLTDERLTQPLVALLTVSVPLFALLFSTDIWTTPDALWGWVALAGALIYAGSWLPLRRWGVAPRVVSAHAVAAAVLLAVALQFFFSSHTLLLTWAVEAAALHWMARRLGDRAVSVTAHALFVVAATWLAQRLLIEFWTREVFNAQAAVDLAVIAAAGLTCRFLDSAQARRWYGLAAFAALVAWLARELAPFTYGQGYTLVAWALVGVALLVTARRVGDRSYTSAAHLLFALAGLWVAARLMTDVESGVAFADPDRVLDLLVIGVGFATSWLSPSSAERDAPAGMAVALAPGPARGRGLRIDRVGCVRHRAAGVRAAARYRGRAPGRAGYPRATRDEALRGGSLATRADLARAVVHGVRRTVPRPQLLLPGAVEKDVELTDILSHNPGKGRHEPAFSVTFCRVSGPPAPTLWIRRPLPPATPRFRRAAGTRLVGN
jgi:hypothetical protein